MFLYVFRFPYMTHRETQLFSEYRKYEVFAIKPYSGGGFLSFRAVSKRGVAHVAFSIYTRLLWKRWKCTVRTNRCLCHFP